MSKLCKHVMCFAFLFTLSACSTTIQSKKPTVLNPTTTHFVKASFSEFQGWNQEYHDKALEVFLNSCHKIIKKTKANSKHVGADLYIWRNICHSACALSQRYSGDLKGSKLHSFRQHSRQFFEKHFIPYKVGMSNHGSGLTFNSRITGYYEIELHGTTSKHPHFPYPIHKPPANLQHIKGQHKLKRGSIHNGSLDQHNLEIAWVNDLPRLYFMHIQGSGVIRLKEGGEMPIGWAGHNGFAFKPLPQEYLGSSLQIIKQLKIAPHKSHHHMNLNESYTFFKHRQERHPVGAQNVMLTPERSAAIDSRIYPYGIPIWIETKLPYIKGYANGEQYRKLLIAQDRGGAIKGGGRIDLFFGRGLRAEHIASGINIKANMFVLFPKGIRIPSTFNTK